MKKTISLLLALVMCLSLCACGSGNPSSDKSIVLNETRQTDKFEITLTQVEFATYLVDPKDPYAVPTEAILPTDEPSDIKASEGKTLLMYSVNLKYIGKEDFVTVLGDFILNYGDGYTFTDHDVYKSSGGGAWAQVKRTYGSSAEQPFCYFYPLEDTQYILRGYFRIPDVVETEENEPLTLTLKIAGQEFEYTIR